jgi:hypothetical protein
MHGLADHFKDAQNCFPEPSAATDHPEPMLVLGYQCLGGMKNCKLIIVHKLSLYFALP